MGGPTTAAVMSTWKEPTHGAPGGEYGAWKPPLGGGWGEWNWSRPNVCSRERHLWRGFPRRLFRRYQPFHGSHSPGVAGICSFQETRRSPIRAAESDGRRTKGSEGSRREQASLYLLNKPGLWSIHVRDQSEKRADACPASVLGSS